MSARRTRRGFHLRRVQVTLSATKLGARVGAVHEKARPGGICLGINRREINELGDWRGKTSRKCAKLYSSRRGVPDRTRFAPITSAVRRAFPCSELLDYRGWPRRRLHSPRAERMKVKPPSAPSAQSVQTKKKPPVDLAISP